MRANNGDPSGQAVSTIFAGKFHDLSGATLAGWPVASNTANPSTRGVWQYSINGSVWINIGSVSPSEALVLSAATLIRFVPADGFYGVPPPLVVYGLDNTYTGGFTGIFQVAIDATTGGGQSPISATPVEIAVSVNADVWVPSTGGDWGGAGNWSDGVPGNHDIVIIDLPALQTVTFDGGGTATTTTISKLINTGGGALNIIPTPLCCASRGPPSTTAT